LKDYSSHLASGFTLRGAEYYAAWFDELDVGTCRPSLVFVETRAYPRGNDKSTLRLQHIDYTCYMRQPGDQQLLRETFERDVIDKLRAGKN
jgi:hypothetical protein